MASVQQHEVTDPGPGAPHLLHLCEIALDHGDFSAAATSLAVALAGLLPREKAIRIVDMKVRLGEFFTDGETETISAAVLDVGLLGGDVDGYIDGLNVFDTTAIGSDVGARGVLLDGQGSEEGFKSSPNVSALLTVTGANTSTLAQGRASVLVYYSELK